VPPFDCNLVLNIQLSESGSGRGGSGGKIHVYLFIDLLGMFDSVAGVAITNNAIYLYSAAFFYYAM
jgi:hypothetical protein